MSDSSIDTMQPSYLFSTIQDIQSINKILKVYILPWSPVRLLFILRDVAAELFFQPAWMKSGTMDGGSLQSQYVQNYAVSQSSNADRSTVSRKTSELSAQVRPRVRIQRHYALCHLDPGSYGYLSAMLSWLTDLIERTAEL
jgi:hypothetical protein